MTAAFFVSRFLLERSVAGCSLSLTPAAADSPVRRNFRCQIAFARWGGPIALQLCLLLVLLAHSTNKQHVKVISCPKCCCNRSKATTDVECPLFPASPRFLCWS